MGGAVGARQCRQRWFLAASNSAPHNCLLVQVQCLASLSPSCTSVHQPQLASTCLGLCPVPQLQYIGFALTLVPFAGMLLVLSAERDERSVGGVKF